MKNTKNWIKVSLYVLAVVGATLAYPNYSRELNSKLMQANSFNSSAVSLEGQTTYDQYLQSGNKPVVAYKMVFSDATGMGDLQSVMLKLSPLNGATFTVGTGESSVLKKLPQGLQIWKDNGNHTFDPRDQRLMTSIANTYQEENRSISYKMELTPSSSLKNGDLYFLVMQPTYKEVEPNQGFQIGVKQNGIKTSEISPSNSEVLSSAFIFAEPVQVESAAN